MIFSLLCRTAKGIFLLAVFFSFFGLPPLGEEAFASQKTEVQKSVKSVPAKTKAGSASSKPTASKTAASKNAPGAKKQTASSAPKGAKTGASKTQPQRSLSEAEAKRDEAQQKIKALESSYQTNQQTKKRLEKELAQTAEAIKSSRTNIRKIQRDRNKIEGAIKNQNKKISSLKRQIEIEKSIIAETEKQRLELVSSKSKPAWMDNEKESFRNNALLEILAKQSFDAISNLKLQEAELLKVVEENQKSQIKLQGVADNEIAERNRLISERGKRQKAALELQTELNRQKQSLASLKRDEQRLNQLVLSLEKQKAAAPQKTVRTAKQSSPAPASSPMPRSTYLPVAGTIAAKFGQKRVVEGKAGRWSGTVFSIKGIQPVRAVRSGKVVFADYLRGYGNMMILDHGNGYFSVYGNNAELKKDIGDEVKGGETIASVGTANGLTVLYFELRNKGKSIDPSLWLKL